MGRVATTFAISAVLVASAFAHPGIGVVVDTNGNVFYTDLKQVWKLDPAGNKSVAVPNVHTHELYLDAEGNLYGEHLWYTGPQDGSGKWFHRVWKRTPDGKVTEVVPATEGFRTRFSFVQDGHGTHFFVAPIDHPNQVKVRRDGREETLAGGAPGARDGLGTQAGFSDVRWMAFGADGNLYVVDDHDVRRVAPDGTVTTLAKRVGEHRAMSVGVERRHDLMGLCADAEGNVYVANFGARAVKKIGRDGKVTAFARSTFPWSPTGIAVAQDKAYILEYADPFAVRVRVVPISGKDSLQRR